jgi:hypothetical protein
MANFQTHPGGPVNAPGQAQQTAPDNKPQVERATQAEFQVKPPSKAERFKNAFLPQDWAVAAKTGFTNTIIPGLKNIALQTLIATFTGMIYGGGRQAPPTNQPGGYIHYGGFYQGGGYPNQYYGYSNAQQVQTPPQNNVPPRRPEYYQVTLPSGQMEIVKAKMIEYANTYTWCSVGVFYDFCGVTCEYTDRNYGWTIDQIQAAMPTHSHTANGVSWFYLNLPKPTQIK